MDRSGRPGLEYFYAFCEEATYKDSMQAFGRNQIRNSKMNDPAASSGVSSSLLGRHSVLDTACPVLDTGESSRVFWIPAFAGMTNSPQAAGNTTLREFKIQMLQCSKQKPSGSRFWSFEFGSLDIVSDFVLRISDFQILRKSQKSHRLGLETTESTCTL